MPRHASLRSLREAANPVGERYGISGGLDSIVELKSIQADYSARLRSYQPKIPWRAFLGRRLRDIFHARLNDADGQIRDTKQILGLVDRCGATILVNQGTPAMNSFMVSSFLAHAIQRLPDPDVIVYLSGRP